MVRNLLPIWIMFCYVFFCNIIKAKHFFYCFIILSHLISSFSFTRSFFVPYTYSFLVPSIESFYCLPLSPFQAILLISSAKTLCLSLLNLCCVFNIIYCSYEFFMVFFFNKRNYLFKFYFFLHGLFYSQIELLIKRFVIF